MLAAVVDVRKASRKSGRSASISSLGGGKTVSEMSGMPAKSSACSGSTADASSSGPSYPTFPIARSARPSPTNISATGWKGRTARLGASSNVIVCPQFSIVTG
ncbi:MAG: hypothetical protein ACRDZO_14985 [Egibacteraceae bacterium]